MASNNFLSFFTGGTRGRELGETRASWDRAQAQWKASPLATLDAEDFAEKIVRNAIKIAGRVPSPPVIAALCELTEELLRAEDIGPIQAFWPVIESNIEAAMEFREMLARRSRWATQYDRMHSVFFAELSATYHAFIKALPEACFEDERVSTSDTFEVPLIDLIDTPGDAIQSLVALPFSDVALGFDLFKQLRDALRHNLLVASGEKSLDGLRESNVEIVGPTAQKGKSARELADLYLSGTPFTTLLDLPVPFWVPDAVRFEHCHVIGGTGHGKTQLLQKMIYTDLVAAQYDKRSVVVIDSQGDLIQKLSHLELFSPFVGGGLGERLILIDPSDVEYPAALNLFDAHLDRLKTYSPADRERVLNGVVELYETFFDALLGAELTQRQDVVFRYLARLMVTIPGATIHTFMEIMDNGRVFKPHMEKLEGSAKRFFETEFFSPSFVATKSQIAKRLWGVLSTPAFERMFSQKENKLDLFEALNDGKIILVNTAKDLLKEEGSQLFGRFFIAMLAQAALERSTIPEQARTPTFVYVDEAHEYFDDRIETILSQARKFRVGLTLSHQTLDQLSTRLRSALLTNTSMKCVGGVSAKDARALADELHTTPEFIDGMRRRGPKTEFAVWVKHQTPHAVRLSVPLGFLERQHVLEDEDFDLLRDANRKKYCGSLEALTREEPTKPLVEGAQAPPDKSAATVDQVTGPARINHPVSLPSTATEVQSASLAPEVRESGKGGPKHRYLQSLVKELAIQHGLKATIEASLPNGTGQVDVLIERDGVLAAVEISVSTPVEHERENVRKCLAAGFPRLGVVLAKSKATQSRYEAMLLEGLSQGEQERITFLTPEGIPDFIVSLAPLSAPSVAVVKGYKVTVAHATTNPDDVRTRREAVAKVIARSLGKQ
jgi:hypothetical protein